MSHAPDTLCAGLNPEVREQKSLGITELFSLVTGHGWLTVGRPYLTGQAINVIVTFRRVRLTIVAMEKQ